MKTGVVPDVAVFVFYERGDLRCGLFQRYSGKISGEDLWAKCETVLRFLFSDR